jgi:putative FmdB family regulatory protein
LPIYEYRCANGHTFEIKQSMSDDPIRSCQVCEAPVERVFHPVAVHFKGAGFYATDYGRSRGAAGGDSDDLKGESKAESKSESKSDSKSESKQTAASKSDSSSSSGSSGSSGG